MPPALLRLTFAALCLLTTMPALAITVTRVEVKVSGPDNDVLADNVRAALARAEAHAALPAHVWAGKEDLFWK